jgi:2-phosphosulfolactate phosphatase
MKSQTLEVLFAPAEFAALKDRDLRETVCIVFDVLRATSTMITALANGAEAIIPVAEIPEALEVRKARAGTLLAGERNGLRISASLTGSIDFDLGNSPREFTSERIGGKTVAMSTTNGTRALRACAAARAVLPGSVLNLGALARYLKAQKPSSLLLVCSGTIDQVSYEDVLGAGALCERIWAEYEGGSIADSALMARRLFRLESKDLFAGISSSRNGRRLLGIPELREDVAFCARPDVYDFIAQLDSEGVVHKAASR